MVVAGRRRRERGGRDPGPPRLGRPGTQRATALDTSIADPGWCLGGPDRGGRGGRLADRRGTGGGRRRRRPHAASRRCGRGAGGSGRASTGRPLRAAGRRPTGPGPAHHRGHHRILREDIDQEPSWPSWSGLPGRSSPRRPASTTGPAWLGPSTRIWPTAPRSSWPRWAPTGWGRSPSCAGGAHPTSP